MVETRSASSAKRRKVSSPSSSQLARYKKPRFAKPFRLLDLPKELRLLIYEFAFAIKLNRHVFIRVFDQTCHSTTRAMLFYRETTQQPHSLLLANKIVFNEAIDIFHKYTVFDVRTYLDKTESSTRARTLGPVLDTGVFRHIQNLRLHVNLDESDDPFQPQTQLSHLVTAIGRARKLAEIHITLFYRFGDMPPLEGEVARPIFFALGGLATRRTQVDWFEVEGFDDEGEEVLEWIPVEYQKMAGELALTMLM